MEWEISKCNVLYAEAIEYLKNSLGITKVDIDHCHSCLLPYQVVIVKYLNKSLIELGTDNIKTKIEKILDIFDEGADRIVNWANECRPVLNPDEVIVNFDDDDNVCGSAIDFAEEIGCDVDDERFHCCRFIFAWTNFLTALCIRLKFQYAYLFAPSYDGECCKCGTRGETVKDQESWVSNVYPEDELYDRTNYERTNSAWQVSKDRYCDCYRHRTEESDDTNSGE